MKNRSILLFFITGLLATGAPLINSTGLSNPQTIVTFSEITFPSGTVITDQFAGLGITLSGHHYNSQGDSPFPGIDGDYVGVSTSVPFSIFFANPITEAAFGYAKNPTTVTIEALLHGVVVDSFQQAVTYDNPATGFLGFTGVLLDQIRVTANVEEGLIDNVQFSTASAVPEPSTVGLLSLGVAGLIARKLSRKNLQ